MSLALDRYLGIAPNIGLAIPKTDADHYRKKEKFGDRWVNRNRFRKALNSMCELVRRQIDWPEGPSHALISPNEQPTFKVIKQRLMAAADVTVKR